MTIIFLPQAGSDLRWFANYYRARFPEGALKARASLNKALSLVEGTPMMGRPIAEDGIREYAIPRTPFSLIYRLLDGRIEILRLWDQRAERPEYWIDR